MPIGPGFNHYYDPGFYIGDFPPVPYNPSTSPWIRSNMIDPMARIAELEARIAALESKNAAADDVNEDHHSFGSRMVVLYFDLGEDTLESHQNRLDDLWDEIVPAVENANFGIITYYCGQFSIEEVPKKGRAYPEAINFIENETD